MTLQLYILRQLIQGLIFAVGGMLVVAVPGMAIGAIQRLGGAFVGLIVGYLPLEFVDLVPYFVPIGFLLAVVSTYSRMAADNEWTAMNMAGFSPMRLFMPGFILAVLLGVVTWYLATAVAPPVDLIKREYRNGALVKGFRSLSPGRTQFRIRDFVLSSRFREGNEFREAQINIPGADGEEDQQLLADRLSIEMTETELVIHAQGARYIHSTRDAFVGALTIRRNLDSLFEGNKPGDVPVKYLSSRDLRAELASGRVPEHEIASATFRLHDRDSKIAVCLMFFLIGAPIGLLLSGGTQLGAMASAVGCALVYYMISLRFGRDLGSNGTIPAWLGAWGGTFLGMLTGLLLLFKVLRR